MKDCIGYKVFKAIRLFLICFSIGYYGSHILTGKDMSLWDVAFISLTTFCIGYYSAVLWNKINKN